jgi:hypothetical protein
MPVNLMIQVAGYFWIYRQFISGSGGRFEPDWVAGYFQILQLKP